MQYGDGEEGSRIVEVCKLAIIGKIVSQGIVLFLVLWQVQWHGHAVTCPMEGWEAGASHEK